MSLPVSDLNKKADGLTTMELGKVLPLTAEVKDDHLFIGGCDMVEIAKEFGTALYVFDQADLEARMDEYVQSFKKYYGDRAEVAYASKAFQNKAYSFFTSEMMATLSAGSPGAVGQLLNISDLPFEKGYYHDFLSKKKEDIPHLSHLY